jgi:hypothetical protein
MADAFKDLKDKIEGLKKEVDNLRVLIGRYNKELSRCDEIESKIFELLKSSLASPEKWNENKDKQAEIIKKVKEDLPDRIQKIKESLIRSSSEHVLGVKGVKTVVVSGIILLVAVMGFYISLHYCPKMPFYDKNNAAQFFEAIGRVKGTILKPNVTFNEVTTAMTKLKAENDPFTSEFSERINYLKGFVSNFENNEETFPQNDQRLIEIKEKIGDLEKKAKGLAQNDGFFWITGYWRWLEIVFWGEFGVITGILVWVCMQVQKGKYSKMMYEREKYWYITEVVIGPVVVVAVFFLLKQFIGTIIEGITEEEVRGSIYMTLGLSFALGLYIRRTLGIFDFIKNKLPLPES